METSARKHLQWLADEVLRDARDDWGYSLAQKTVAGGIREYVKGYRVEYEAPGVKAYESRTEPGKAIIVAKAHGRNYLRWEDYNTKGGKA